MVGVNDARPRIAEHVEILRVAVAFQENDVVRVDCPNGVHQPPVERHDDLLARVVGLVDRVVARHPGVVPVVGGEGLPQVDRAVLEVLVLPEQRLVGGVVAVPVLVLVAGHGMQIDDRVDALRAHRSITRSSRAKPGSLTTKGALSSSKCR